MRPERTDIAAPPFPPGLDWVGGEPPAMERLCAKGPVLVHFFEASEASSARSLDWLRAWHAAYGALGLRVIGIHTPRSGFAREPADLERAVSSLAITYPVANDSERRLWRDYGCKGWPSLFLWRRGGALVWIHFGEGEYQATERAIREELTLGSEGDDARTETSGEEEVAGGAAEVAAAAATAALPPPVVASRRSDAEGAKVVAPSEEFFPGGSHEVPLEGGAGEPIDLRYEAGAVYVALSGSGTVGGSIDGAPFDPIEVDGPVTVPLAEHGTHGRHELSLAPGLGTRVWSIGFGAGIP